jgi:hypothetical protein
MSISSAFNLQAGPLVDDGHGEHVTSLLHEWYSSAISAFKVIGANQVT